MLELNLLVVSNLLICFKGNNIYRFFVVGMVNILSFSSIWIPGRATPFRCDAVCVCVSVRSVLHVGRREREKDRERVKMSERE